MDKFEMLRTEIKEVIDPKLDKILEAAEGLKSELEDVKKRVEELEKRVKYLEVKKREESTPWKIHLKRILP